MRFDQTNVVALREENYKKIQEKNENLCHVWNTTIAKGAGKKTSARWRFWTGIKAKMGSCLIIGF
jgi:hypothetical protein